MKNTHAFTFSSLQTVVHRSVPVRFRFHLPNLPKWFGHQNSRKPDPRAGIDFEPGHERFSGNGYYSISEHEHDLERLIEMKTTSLMTTPNR